MPVDTTDAGLHADVERPGPAEQRAPAVERLRRRSVALAVERPDRRHG
jgi:hypothetical protein